MAIADSERYSASQVLAQRLSEVLQVEVIWFEICDAANQAFYPLTMPITTGPGTISVAIALGTGGASDVSPLIVIVQALVTTVLICLLIYLLYRSSGQISRAIGQTGTAIVARLSAFLLFCIGIQVMWTCIAELVASLPGS